MAFTLRSLNEFKGKKNLSGLRFVTFWKKSVLLLLQEQLAWLKAQSELAPT
jgi:hypothetical protein